MAPGELPRNPEEIVEELARQVREGKLSRNALLRELMKLGLGEQKRWKAISYVQSGRVDIGKGAEIAGMDGDSLGRLVQDKGGGPQGKSSEAKLQEQRDIAAVEGRPNPRTGRAKRGKSGKRG